MPTQVNFQRRHYEFIAGVIREECKYGSELKGHNIAQRFCIALRATNPNFNADRFMRACGVEG